MPENFAQLCFLPPPLDAVWRGLSPDSHSMVIDRDGNTPLFIRRPMFWFDPPWYRMPLDTACALANTVAELGITVSALRRDCVRDGQSWRLGQPNPASDSSEPTRCTRMLPYRPERYGLTVEDFDQCQLIDVRLAMSRDTDGAHVYSQQQIKRWDTAPDGAAFAGGNWVPAGTFPPDVVSLETLGPKIIQLRKLSPESAIFVSLGPFRLRQELPRLLGKQHSGDTLPDGVIIRMDLATLSPLQLAQQILGARDIIDNAGRPNLPLWVVPPEITADDAAKMIALGADAVAVDSWCQEIVDELLEPSEGTRAAFGYQQRDIVISGDQHWSTLRAWVAGVLNPRIDRFSGLVQSCAEKGRQALGSFDPQWATTLGIEVLGIQASHCTDVKGA
jgi:hypothetical protein